ncbi:hypothetical protein V1511DRAFT_503011 [Dipodascopsis uninucleata]
MDVIGDISSPLSAQQIADLDHNKISTTAARNTSTLSNGISNAGIVTTESGERIIPTSLRKDGSKRKEIRVRPGFIPVEDASRYNAAERVQMRRERLAKEQALKSEKVPVFIDIAEQSDVATAASKLVLPGENPKKKASPDLEKALGLEKLSIREEELKEEKLKKEEIEDIKVIAPQREPIPPPWKGSGNGFGESAGFQRGPSPPELSVMQNYTANRAVTESGSSSIDIYTSGSTIPVQMTQTASQDKRNIGTDTLNNLELNNNSAVGKQTRHSTKGQTRRDYSPVKSEPLKSFDEIGILEQATLSVNGSWQPPQEIYSPPPEVYSSDMTIASDSIGPELNHMIGGMKVTEVYGQQVQGHCECCNHTWPAGRENWSQSANSIAEPPSVMTAEPMSESKPTSRSRRKSDNGRNGDKRRGSTSKREDLRSQNAKAPTESPERIGEDPKKHEWKSNPLPGTRTNYPSFREFMGQKKGDSIRHNKAKGKGNHNKTNNNKNSNQEGKQQTLANSRE